MNPYPQWWPYRTLVMVGWLVGVVAGVWVIVNPPPLSAGLSHMLTIAWGLMLGTGSLLAGVGTFTRHYKLETPGLFLVLGGVMIVVYLSWETHHAGPRALLLVLLAFMITARIGLLFHLDGEARRRLEGPA